MYGGYQLLVTLQPLWLEWFMRAQSGSALWDLVWRLTDQNRPRGVLKVVLMSKSGENACAHLCAALPDQSH